MESDVLLIEIVGEDDSLLQLPPDDAVSSSSTNKISKDDAFFFCSPLQPLRSKPLVTDMHKAGLKVKSSSNSCDMTDSQRKFDRIPLHEDQISMGQEELSCADQCSGNCVNKLQGEQVDLPKPLSCEGYQMVRENSVVIDCGKEKPGPLDLPNTCYTGEQVFEECRFTIPEESQQKITLRCVELKEAEGTGVSTSESEVSKTLSLMPPAVSDYRSNEAEIVKSQDNFASVSEDKAMVESYNLDSRNASQFNCQDYCLELDSVDEVQTIGAGTGDFTSLLNLNLLVEDTSGEPINLMGDKINFSGEEISVMSASCLNAEDRILNQSREFFEECLTDNIGNCADMSSKVSDFGGIGPQSPHGKYKRLDEESKQVDEGSDMIKERALGDLREQSSVSNYACSAVVNNVYEELAGNPELHRPNVDVIRGSQDISPGSCLNGTLLSNNTSCKDFVETVHEEILTKKSGAVQNSPPSKSQPQRGPWSPVKRKANQVIGPFDCTKHTNNGLPTSQ
ncbi:hypothetical protein DVH24_006004 [Malus domestica]|uniref:Uncharacterized protein n=2 Tax=Malus domestica TaxID=3750 RepID=A0A498IQL6_MALDO|nr:hypothetical protein DVH24_006004 [Malus domestica]